MTDIELKEVKIHVAWELCQEKTEIKKDFV